MQRKVFGSALLLGLCASFAFAGAGQFRLEKGFTRLDNGKDLKGWKGNLTGWSVQDGRTARVFAAHHSRKGNLTGWSVQDGAIYLDAKKAKGDIYSETVPSKNCIIRMQFKADERADSGVYIYGKQLQVRDYPKVGPGKYASAAKPAGEWNELEFDITDGVAVVKLNGKVIEKAWRIGNNADRGLGLQRERGNFAFRYIRFMNKD